MPLSQSESSHLSARHLNLHDWGWRHAGRKDWALRHVNLRIESGERVLLLGASGSGKSTLLHAIAGLLGRSDEGEQEGVLLLDGVPPAPGRAALVMQDPESGIVLARVGDDVAFGPENMRVPRDEIWERVGTCLEDVGLDVPWDRSTAELSGGQQQRLVLAGALAMGSDWLLLDEPTANLDPVGVAEIRKAVARVVAGRARGLIVVEHRAGVWAPLMDRVVVLGSRGIVADGPPDKVFSEMGAELAAMGVWVPQYGGTGPANLVAREAAPEKRSADGSVEEAPSPVVTSSESDWILRGRNLAVGYKAGPVLSGVNIDIRRGASTVLVGPNGSGKTTLAMSLAGLLPRLGGEVTSASDLATRGITDPEKWKSRELLTRIGTVFQNPEHQFVTATVWDEVAVGLRALKKDQGFIEEEVKRLLGILHLSHLAKASPFSLSGGEKRRLSVGTVLATNPAVIVLDEPTFGQDRTTWTDLVTLIASLRDQGTTIVSVTHDEAYIRALGDVVIDVGVLMSCAGDQR
ncbi:MAG: energy-coupling factor ABC transporter ATP-binding protein [Propionibacteriaceae bacterium]|jgi:energy-coupling factor transport system ATP-binding protein|nr:energy-coupling factor ABC transporter ATP-binding protein [Propionibacteriaceae bacterium]